MNWEQKLEALKSLCDIRLIMRTSRDWYIDSHMEIADGVFLSGEYGNGNSPEEAVNNHWELYTNDSDIGITKLIKADEKYWYWKRFMWKEVDPYHYFNWKRSNE